VSIVDDETGVKGQKGLSTTAYSVLGLLSLREWTAYELERQTMRSLRFITPRARSVVYEEPKRLVRRGLATSRSEQRGRRTVAVYSISDAGREALRAWFDLRADFPSLEAPMLMRTLFAPAGTREGVLRALQDCEREGGELLDALQRQGVGYLQDGGPFPERLPWIALNYAFLAGWIAWLRGWSSWAADQVATLPDDPDDARERALGWIGTILAGDLPPGLDGAYSGGSTATPAQAAGRGPGADRADR
jgi:DNA-binding PadR family transcriptional regulator